MPKYITIRYTVEPADGLPDQITGMHVTDETAIDADGQPTTYWLAARALDRLPAGSPKSHRQIAKRAIADVRGETPFVPRKVVAPKLVNPVADGFESR